MNFKQAHESNFRSGRTSNIKYLVIHFTSNDNDTAKNNVDYYARTPNLKASAHYYVDKTEVWQSVKESDTAYHCGANTYIHPYCRNSNSIGIEMCSRYNGDIKKDKKANTVDFSKYYFDDAVIDNAVNFTKELMAKYNIPAENVIRHYDVTHKTCPAPFVKNPGAWENFKKRLVEVKELESVNDIVWELANCGIITDKELWLKKLEEDTNAYWLARKTVKYLLKD